MHIECTTLYASSLLSECVLTKWLFLLWMNEYVIRVTLACLAWFDSSVMVTLSQRPTTAFLSISVTSRSAVKWHQMHEGLTLIPYFKLPKGHVYLSPYWWKGYNLACLVAITPTSPSDLKAWAQECAGDLYMCVFPATTINDPRVLLKCMWLAHACMKAHAIPIPCSATEPPGVCGTPKSKVVSHSLAHPARLSDFLIMSF